MKISSKYKKKAVRKLPSILRRKIVRSQMPGMQLDLEGILFKPAESIDDYMKCFSLLHDVYVQAGYTEPTDTALRIVPHHFNALSKVFIGSYIMQNSHRMPVYTVSLFPDSAAGLPMDEAFNAQLNALRRQGRKIAEAGCLASNPRFRMQNMNIPMLGNRVVFEYATKYLDVDDLVITIHPKHLWVYQDLLLFEKIGEINAYSYVKNNPAVAMKLNLRAAREKYKKTYSRFPAEKNLHYFFFKGRSCSIDLEGEGQTNNLDLRFFLMDYFSSFQKAG